MPTPPLGAPLPSPVNQQSAFGAANQYQRLTDNRRNIPAATPKFITTPHNTQPTFSPSTIQHNCQQLTTGRIGRPSPRRRRPARYARHAQWPLSVMGLRPCAAAASTYRPKTGHGYKANGTTRRNPTSPRPAAPLSNNNTPHSFLKPAAPNATNRSSGSFFAPARPSMGVAARIFGRV